MATIYQQKYLLTNVLINKDHCEQTSLRKNVVVNKSHSKQQFYFLWDVLLEKNTFLFSFIF